jgi:ferrous iron transport protein B
MAKEIVVSTLSQVYLGNVSQNPSQPTTLAEDITSIGSGFVQAGVRSGRILLSILPGVNLISQSTQSEDTLLSLALRDNFSTLGAISLLVFVLLYVPCVATLGAIKHEFGMSWAVTSAIYQTVVAWIFSFIIYQVGLLLGFG